jgi:hypothetical protein
VAIQLYNHITTSAFAFPSITTAYTFPADFFWLTHTPFYSASHHFSSSTLLYSSCEITATANMASTNPGSYDAQASTNYKEAFALFDKRGNQRVALDSLGDLLRACGQNPTLSEIRDLEKNIGSDCMLIPRTSGAKVLMAVNS